MSSAAPPPSLPAALAEHAAAHPEEPWLFFRGRVDWQWRSWGQVADQVARAADALRRAAVRERIAGPRIGFDGRPGPDAVAIGLAVEAAGLVAVPHWEAEGPPWDGWAEVGAEAAEGDASEPPRIRLPEVRSRLERWRAEPITSEAIADPGLWRAAAELDGRLPAFARRPIVLASPGLGAAAMRTLLAWTLRTGAAWALEPEPELFLPAVLRTRPTLVLAPAEELALLAQLLARGRHRRWHRLQAVVVCDQTPPEKECTAPWSALGVTVVAWPPPAEPAGRQESWGP